MRQQSDSSGQVTNENQVTSESDSQLGSVLSDILATGLECSMRESSVGYHVQSHCAYAWQLQYFVLKSENKHGHIEFGYTCRYKLF